MRPLLRNLGLLTVMIAAGAAAQTPDPHAGHHPTDPKASPSSPPAEKPCPCPMMQGAQRDGTKPGDKTGRMGERMDHCKDMPQPDHHAGDGR